MLCFDDQFVFFVRIFILVQLSLEYKGVYLYNQVKMIRFVRKTFLHQLFLHYSSKTLFNFFLKMVAIGVGMEEKNFNGRYQENLEKDINKEVCIIFPRLRQI